MTPDIEPTSTYGFANPISVDELRQRWLGGTPCHPPCWEGITPGETSASEAAEILSANSLFTSVEVVESPLPGVDTGFVSFEWQVLPEGEVASVRRGDARFDYTTVDQIIYAIRVVFPEMRLGDLVQIYGEPSHVMAVGSPPTDIDGPYSWHVDIVWVGRGLTMRTGGFTELQVDENLILRSATYFVPTLEGYGRATSLFCLEHVKPWRGYADFDAYFEPTPAPEDDE